MAFSSFKTLLLNLSLGILSLMLGAASPYPGPGGPPTRYLFRSYAHREGLKDLSTERLAQDAFGMIWIGTQRGLYRYDGFRFKAFQKKDGLPANYVTALTPARSGVLWVGTWEGLAYQSGSQFISGANFPKSRILAIAQSHDDLIWAASQEGPLIGGISGFRLAEGWTFGEATALAMDPEGEAWVASGAKLYRLSRFGEWHLHGTTDALKGESIESMVITPGRKLFLRSAHHLASLDLNAPQAFEHHTPRLPGSRILCGPLRIDEEGSVWVPMEDGIAHQSPQGWTLITPTQGLPTNSIQDVLFDHEGSMWVAAQGLHRMLGRNTWRAVTHREGLPGDKVWMILRDSKGRLVIGANRGAVRAGATSWEPIPGSQDMSCLALTVDRDGNLWMGGTRGQLKVNLAASNQTLSLGEAFGLGHQRILTLLADPKGRLWAGTDTGGLLVANLHGARTFERVDLPKGSLRERINFLMMDESQTLWVAGEQGLARLQNETWQRFTTDDGLRHNHVLYMACAPQRLLVSYFDNSGYSTFTCDSKALKLQEHLLENHSVTALGADRNNRIWIATDQGLFLKTPEGQQKFKASNGLVGEDCNQGAIWVDEDGGLWLGTSTGLAHLAQAGRIQNPIPPTVVISDLYLGEQSVWPIQENRVRSKRGQASVELHFTPQTFAHEENTQCQYRLKGLDDTWQITHSGEAIFPKLQPGHYEFQARCRIGDGEWGPPTTLPIEVPAAWWQWKSLRALALLALVAWVTRWVILHIKKLKRKNLELEALLSLADTLTHELEASNLSLKEQSLTDSLTGLRNRRYLDSTIQKDLALVERQHSQADYDASATVGSANIDMLFLMVDVDHFKWVNDTLGHAAGDAILEQLARVLKSATRGSDTVIRWGGEEFLVVAKQTRRQDATVLAERVRKAVSGYRFELPGGGFLRRTCSIGFAPYPLDGISSERMNWEQAVELADQCMYRAKERGRNRWIGLMPADTLQPESNLTNLDLMTIVEAGFAAMVSSE